MRTPPSTPRPRRKPPWRKSPRLPENSLPKSWKPRRRDPSSTCGKLARDPMLTPSGRRRRSTRRRKRKRRKLSSTFNDRLVRRSLTSTSPLPTRGDVVEVTVDAEVVAVVMAKDAPPTGSDVKVRRVSVAHQGNPGSQDQRERKASNSQGEVEVKEAEVAAVAKDVGPEEAVANPAVNSASTRRLSPPWGNEEQREERSYDLLILYREHSSEEHKIKKILPQRFYVFLSIFYTTPKKNIDIQFP